MNHKYEHIIANIVKPLEGGAEHDGLFEMTHENIIDLENKIKNII